MQNGIGTEVILGFKSISANILARDSLYKYGKGYLKSTSMCLW